MEEVFEGIVEFALKALQMSELALTLKQKETLRSIVIRMDTSNQKRLLISLAVHVGMLFFFQDCHSYSIYMCTYSTFFSRITRLQQALQRHKAPFLPTFALQLNATSCKKTSPAVIREPYFTKY